MGIRRTNGDALCPAGTTIGRGECGDIVAQERHNYGTVGLHKRLPTEARGIVSRCLSGSPGFPTVGRGTHLYEVASRGVIPFGIAVAVVWATAGIVAGDPILVKEDTIGSFRDSHGILPGQASIGRAIDQYSCTNRATTLIQNGEAGCQPDLVFGVINNGRVADTSIDALRTGVHGSTRERAMLPGIPIIRGGGPAIIGTATVTETS